MGSRIARQDPPAPWLSPRQRLEKSLFQYSVDECLTMIHLSREELREWTQKGWLSFEVDKVKKIDDPEWTELCEEDRLRALRDRIDDHLDTESEE